MVGRTQKHRVEAVLSPELYNKFLEIKEWFGLSNANVLRVLILNEYARLYAKSMRV